jgi:hypothetical protein
MWNYFYYIAYLLEKKETDYTGLESFVRDKINNKDISWFPIIDDEIEEDKPEGKNNESEVEENFSQQKSKNLEYKKTISNYFT